MLIRADDPFVTFCGSCGAPMRACGCRKYDDDPVWDALFARSQDVLEAMAKEALEDFRAGRTRPIEELWAEECPRVSLPTEPVDEIAPAEETQAS